MTGRSRNKFGEPANSAGIVKRLEKHLQGCHALLAVNNLPALYFAGSHFPLDKNGSPEKVGVDIFAALNADGETLDIRPKGYPLVFRAPNIRALVDRDDETADGLKGGREILEKIGGHLSGPTKEGGRHECQPRLREGLQSHTRRRPIGGWRLRVTLPK